MYNCEDSAQLNKTFFTAAIAPNPPKWTQQGLEPKKQLFLLGKFENGKKPEVEVWYPERKDRRSYYRLCENF